MWSHVVTGSERVICCAILYTMYAPTNGCYHYIFIYMYIRGTVCANFVQTSLCLLLLYAVDIPKMSIDCQVNTVSN